MYIFPVNHSLISAKMPFYGQMHLSGRHVKSGYITALDFFFLLNYTPKLSVHIPPE